MIEDNNNINLIEDNKEDVKIKRGRKKINRTEEEILNIKNQISEKMKEQRKNKMILKGGKQQRTKEYNYTCKDGTIIKINLKNEFKKCGCCNEILHYINYYYIYDLKSKKYYLLPKCQECYKKLYEEKKNNNINN